MKELEIDKIRPDQNQPRKDFEKEGVAELAASLKTQGMIYPIEIEENNIIICGERRWRAAKLAGWKKVPVVIKTGLEKEERKAGSIGGRDHRFLPRPSPLELSISRSELTPDMRSMRAMPRLRFANTCDPVSLRRLKGSHHQSVSASAPTAPCGYHGYVGSFLRCSSLASLESLFPTSSRFSSDSVQTWDRRDRKKVGGA